MNPYYSDSHVTIYHGDCREVLPSLPKVDLVLTDPPFNVGKQYGHYKDNLPLSEYVDLLARVWKLYSEVPQAWVMPEKNAHIYYANAPPFKVVVVRRGAAGPKWNAWTNQFNMLAVMQQPERQTPDLWEGIRLKGEGYFFREHDCGHPGYTPEALTVRMAGLFPSAALLLDPFAGTGTSLRVAKSQNRKAIGIEIEEKYAEIAADRCRQEVLDL